MWAFDVLPTLYRSLWIGLVVCRTRRSLTIGSVVLIDDCVLHGLFYSLPYQYRLFSCYQVLRVKHLDFLLFIDSLGLYFKFYAKNRVPTTGVLR